LQRTGEGREIPGDDLANARPARKVTSKGKRPCNGKKTGTRRKTRGGANVIKKQLAS